YHVCVCVCLCVCVCVSVCVCVRVWFLWWWLVVRLVVLTREMAGYKQQGEAAEKAHNVFFWLTYPGSVNIDTIDDPMQKRFVPDACVLRPSSLALRRLPTRVSRCASLRNYRQHPAPSPLRHLRS